MNRHLPRSLCILAFAVCLAPTLHAQSITYSSFLGGDGTENLRNMTADAAGNLYLTGLTFSSTFLGQEVNFDSYYAARINADGSLGYASVFGASQPYGVAVDAVGNAYFAGSSLSDYPATNVIAPQGINDSAGEVFLVKLDPNGNEVFSTLIRGSESDEARGVAINSRGEIVIVGTTSSTDLPTVEGGIQPERLGDRAQPFVMILDPSGTEILSSTYIGVSGQDSIDDIVIDSQDRVLIAGTTTTPDFPTVNAFQEQIAGGTDMFVARLLPDLSDADLITYIGGTGSDRIPAIAVSNSGAIHVAGRSTSTDFPTVNALFSEFTPSLPNTVVTVLEEDGSVRFSTYLGAIGAETSNDIDVDDSGRISLAGRTLSILEFISTNPFIDKEIEGFAEGYVAELSSDGQTIEMASLIGGSGNDEVQHITWLPDGRLAFAGETDSDDFPIAGSAIQSSYDFRDLFLTIVDLGEGPPTDGIVVRVMRDLLGGDVGPVANTAVEVGRINHGNVVDRFIYVASAVTDDDGRITLDPDQFTNGEAFYVRAYPHQEPAVKTGREDVNGWMYEVEVDNVVVDTRGNFIPDTLRSAMNTTSLLHTTIKYNLVVSLEWDPQPFYTSRLKTALAVASNLLFDASNGQIQFNKIAIYGGKEKWDEADLRIYANNQTWPSANPDGILHPDGHIYYPPKLYGSKEDNANLLYWDDGVALNDYLNISAFVHEFGHYAFHVFDEYQSRFGFNLPDGWNLSIMDKQGRRSDPEASEFSAYLTNRFRLTEAQRRNPGPAWDVIRKRLSGTYGQVRAQIHTPRMRGLQAPALIEGPNADIANPDWDVGSLVEFIDKTAPDPLGPLIIRIREENGRTPAKGVFVEFEDPETGLVINQGKTVLTDLAPERFASRGNMTGRGGRRGMQINVSSTGADGSWQYHRQLFTASKGHNDEIDITLAPIAGNIRMRPAVAFAGGGQLDVGIRLNERYGSDAKLYVLREGAGAEEVDLTALSTLLLGEIPGPNVSDARLRLELPDSLGTTFFVPMNLSVNDVGQGAITRPEGDDVEIEFDSSAAAPEKLSILVSRFPEFRDGLTSTARRVSPTYMIDAFPVGSPMTAEMKIYYQADSLVALDSSAVTIFRWDDGWKSLETRTNPVPRFESASTTVTQPGLYAAFIDLERAVPSSNESVRPRDTRPEVPDEGRLQLEPNYPNPFGSETELSFRITGQNAPVGVSLEIYDLLGRRLTSLIDASLLPGRHTLTWDGTASDGRFVPAGAYVAVLRVDGRMSSRIIHKAGR